MNKISKILINAFQNGNKVLIFGCGGSATMSNHFAAEFINKIKKDRRALPAISLASNNAVLTAIANDFDFDLVYSRQIEALGNKGDIVIGISTSGKSDSVLNGFIIARDKGCIVINFPRKGKDVCEIQDYQLKLMHKIACEVEEAFCK